MRSSAGPSWFEHRHAVPLTGREPVLGRLLNRLQKRGSGWGWLTLQGPPGCGVSRMLQEVARLVVQNGAPPPIWIHPVREGRDALESLRRALRPALPGDGLHAVQRSIDALLPLDPHARRILAEWLTGAGPVHRSDRLDPLVLARLLGRVCTSGPVLVDEVGDLEADVLRVLRIGLQAGGPDVIAGTTSSRFRSEPHPVWHLEPLGGSQIELLLRRWLRHPATARRLAGTLSERCEGWPGRVVGAVRELGRQGCLVKERRGVVFARVPTRWPDGLRRADTFHDDVRNGAEHARRIFDLVAVQGGQASLSYLAHAAETSPEFVGELLAEAVAARGGRAPGLFFAHRAARDRYLEQMPAPRLHDGVLRLRHADPDLSPAGEDTLRRALLDLRVRVHAGEQAEAAVQLHALLAADGASGRVAPWACDALVDVADALVGFGGVPGAEAVALAGHALYEVGRRSQACALFEKLELESLPTTSVLLLARARTSGPEDLRRLLEEHMPHLKPGTGRSAFDLWALLAAERQGVGATPLARQGWREALRAFAGVDPGRRAYWHEGLAACARSRGCLPLAAAHLRRAVRLRRVGGEGHVLPRTLQALGEVEILRGRRSFSVGPLMRAARLHAMLGADAEAIALRQAAGRVLLGLHAYDQAVEELRGALRLVDPLRDAASLPDLHLGLADAFRGCGDLARERHHGQEASKTAKSDEGRLRAEAVVARADVGAGLPGAQSRLAHLEQELRSADCIQDAEWARAVLFHARLTSDDPRGAEALLPMGTARAMRAYAAARLDLSEGRHDAAISGFQSLGGNPTLPVDLRAACYAHLAEALQRVDQLPAAREAAIAAAALLEVRHRSRANDLRLHAVLARVFGGVGDAGRAEGHLFAARRALPLGGAGGRGRRAG